MSSNGAESTLEVAALTGTAIEPSSRFRVRQLAPALSRLGVRVTDLPSTAGRYPPAERSARMVWLPRAIASAARRAARSRSADVCLLHREMVSTLATFEAISGKPRVFDVDDAIYLRQRFGSIQRIASASDVVVCGNAYLAEWFAQFAPVRVIPTVVDTDRYRPQPPADAAPTLGWMGTRGNLRELDEIAPAIERVLRSRPETRLRVVSSHPSEWTLAGHPQVDGVLWSAEREVDELAAFDIGLMPLADTPWTRGKCGFKLITYLACGTAAVASPVGVNTEILQHEDAALAQSEAEWVDRLVALLDEPSERERIASAGRRHVVARYSVDSAAPMLASVLRSVV